MSFIKKIRISLSLRLLLGVVTSAIVVYFLTIRYINYDYEEVAVQMAKEIVNRKAENIAVKIENIFEADFEFFRTYVTAFQQYDHIDPSTCFNFFNKAQERVLTEKQKYLSVWHNWELSNINPNWTLPYGRVLYKFYREDDLVNKKIDSLDLAGDDTTSSYYNYKINPREGITEPSADTDRDGNKVLITSVIVPIQKDNKFIGMVGADISLAKLNFLIDSLNSNIDGYAYLLSSEGSIIAHPNKSALTKNITEYDSLLNAKYSIVETIQQGKQNNFIYFNDSNNNERFYTTIVPVKLGQSNTYWGIAINVPLQKIIIEAQSHFNGSRKVGIYGVLILIIVTLIVAFRIISPIKKTTKVLQKISLGQIEDMDEMKIRTGDEIEQMSHSVNTVISGFKNTVEFANDIKKGDFEKEFNVLSDKDVLGNSVLEMRNSLKTAKEEEEQRQKEEEQSNWVSQGINIFGTILRQNNDNLEKLCEQIISALVDYLGAHQGGIYLTENNNKNKHLKLTGSIGFTKEKMSHTEIQPNEGYPGKCLLEKERIYMDDIPQNYPPILSGLGETKPKSSLYVPMLINKIIIGIIEVGSLKQLEEYQIQFVEKIAVSIASAISSAKVNAQTAELLDKSKIQADELALQEKEMRQTMEELQAMQEEATKRHNSIESFISAAKSTLLYTEYDADGNIIDINDNMLHLFQLKQDQVIGKKIGSYEFSTTQVKNNYEQIWQKLKEGTPAVNSFFTNYLGREYCLREYYYPIINADGVFYKALNISVDISEERRKAKQLEKLKAEYNELKEKVIEKEVKPTNNISISQVFEKENIFDYIDLTHLKKVYKDDLSKIQNIITIYIDTIPKQIFELKTLSSKDLKMLKSKIESLKTKMTYLGLSRIVEISKEVEVACATGVDIEQIEKNLNKIELVWQKAEEELRKIILK